jgi:putative membrane protein
MLRRRLVLLAAGTAGLGGTAWAQASLRPDPTPRLPAQPGQSPALEERTSLQRAARLLEAQVAAGRLGEERAAAAAVRQFAATIAAEHGRFRDALGELAASRRVDLAEAPRATSEDATLAPLREASGEAFDRAFLGRQLGLQATMAELFQSMASNSPDPAIARFGITVLAALQGQFATARRLGEPMGLRAATIEAPPQY